MIFLFMLTLQYFLCKYMRARTLIYDQLLYLILFLLLLPLHFAYSHSSARRDYMHDAWPWRPVIRYTNFQFLCFS